MTRTALIFVLLATPVSARERGSLDKALGLEETLKKVVKDAEPAIASILVSRSEGYARLGAVPAADYAGRLGGFDAQALLDKAPADEARKALVRRLDLARAENVPESHGSGVVVGTGLVLTNYHLVRDAVKVYVQLPGGRGSYADVHAADARSDLAVLKLLAPPADTVALPLGAGEKLAKGQLVLALANDFAPGFRDGSPSASWGLVSNLRYPRPSGRRTEEDRTGPIHRYGTLIQVDVGANLGVSGGALLNLRGELVGLMGPLGALLGQSEPGGFAIPMSAGFRLIVERLKEGKEVEYGFLGINFTPSPGEATRGVLIQGVSQNTPAADVNLPHQQYVVKINGMDVNNSDDLSLAISTSLAGSRITLSVSPTPGGPTRNYTPVLGKLWLPGKFIAANRPPAVGGLRVDYTTTLLGGGLGDRSVERGVAVREVLPGSPAEKANLLVKQVITHVNGRPVATPAEYYREASRAAGSLELTFSNNKRATLPLR